MNTARRSALVGSTGAGTLAAVGLPRGVDTTKGEAGIHIQPGSPTGVRHYRFPIFQLFALAPEATGRPSPKGGFPS
jgi:hypothetical protein